MCEQTHKAEGARGAFPVPLGGWLQGGALLSVRLTIGFQILPQAPPRKDAAEGGGREGCGRIWKSALGGGGGIG